MKRHLKILVTLMIVTSFAIAGLPARAEAEKTVINWMLFGGMGGVQDRIAILEETHPDLMEKYDLRAEVADKHGVAKKLRLALAAGGEEMPDIIKLNMIELVEFVHAGVIEDITDKMLPYKDDILPAAWNMPMIDGKLYGVANQLKPKIWYYRADIFEECGIDPASIKTTDDYIAAGKKIQEKYPNAHMWNYGASMGHYNLEMVIAGNGGRYFDEDGEYIVASDPGVRQAFIDFKKMKDAGIIADIEDWTPDWEQAFANGTIVSTLQASWFKLGYLEKWAPELAGKWEVATWPAIGGGTGGGCEGGGGGVYAILKGSKHVDEAFEVISAITFDRDSAYQLFKQRNVEPLIKSAYEQYPDIREPLP